MAPTKVSKKVVVPVEEMEDELKQEEVVVKAPKTKGKKVVDPVSDAESHELSDPESNDSKGVVKKEKKPRKGSLDKVLTLLKNNKVSEAINMVEDLIGEKKDKKPREPSTFNIFIKYQMNQLKEDKGMNTNEKMKKCSEAWKKEKFDEFAKKRYDELKVANPEQSSEDRIAEVVNEWKSK